MKLFYTIAASVLVSALGATSAPANGPTQSKPVARPQCPILTPFFVSKENCICPKGLAGRKISNGYAQCDYEVKTFLPRGPIQVKKGQKYPAADGSYLVFQADGNIVVYSKDNQHRWDVAQLIGNKAQQIAGVYVEANGKLAAHGRDGKLIWRSTSLGLY